MLSIHLQIYKVVKNYTYYQFSITLIQVLNTMLSLY